MYIVLNFYSNELHFSECYIVVSGAICWKINFIKQHTR